VPETDAVIETFRNEIREHNCDAVRLALHPYLHWTQPDGTVTRGRKNLLAMLKQAQGPLPPASRTELRHGQIYRWAG
jgi:hypothetical protein